jgi:hypothetical protein
MLYIHKLHWPYSLLLCPLYSLSSSQEYSTPNGTCFTILFLVIKCIFKGILPWYFTREIQTLLESIDTWWVTKMVWKICHFCLHMCLSPLLPQPFSQTVLWMYTCLLFIWETFVQTTQD